jgi:hypothetical protein
MRSATYATIEAGVARKLQWPSGALDSQEFESVRDAVSAALSESWRFAWWEFLLVTKQRAFAPAWDSSATYRAGAVVYHEPSDEYYQCLKDATTAVPCSLVGTAWVTASAWSVWGVVETATSYSDTQAYAAGAKVYYLATRRNYQCHTATTAGIAPTDTSRWGLLTDRVNRIDGDEDGFPVIGDVLRVTWTNPEEDLGAVRIDHRMSGGDVIVFGQTPNRPWIQYLPVAPRLTGSPWNPALSYSPDVQAKDDDMANMIGYSGYAQLRARTEHTDRQIANVFWGNSPDDGAGGWFRYVASSADADNGDSPGGGTRIRPTDNPLPSLGCWHRTL